MKTLSQLPGRSTLKHAGQKHLLLAAQSQIRSPGEKETKSKASQEGFKLNHRLRQDPGTTKNLCGGRHRKRQKPVEKCLPTGTGVNKTRVGLQ